MKDGALYLCDECGRDVSRLGPLVACICGSTLRRRVDTAGAMYRRPLTADAPPWDPFKDWTVKYLQFMWNVVQLRRMYARGSEASSDEVRGIIDTTFASCSELADWLTRGPEPVSVTPGDITRLITTEPLSVCLALFPAAGVEVPATSRVLPVSFVSPPQFWVQYLRPGARPVRYDALDLAERCMHAWQTFLTQREVPLPTWQS